MMKPDDDDDVMELAKAPRRSLPLEFWDFLRQNKKWWLFPVLFVVLLLGALVFLGGSGGGAFIYTLF